MSFILDRPTAAPLVYSAFSQLENADLMLKNVHFSIFAQDDTPAVAIGIFSETR